MIKFLGNIFKIFMISFALFMTAAAVEVGVSERGLSLKTEPTPVPDHFTGKIIWGEDWADHTAGTPAAFIPVKLYGVDDGGSPVGWVVKGKTDEGGNFDLVVGVGVKMKLAASGTNEKDWSYLKEVVIFGKYASSNLKYFNCAQISDILVDCTQPRYEDFTKWEKLENLPTVTFDDSTQAHMIATDKHYTYIRKEVPLIPGTIYNLEILVSNETAVDAKGAFTTDDNRNVHYFTGPGLHKVTFTAVEADKHVLLFAYDKEVIYRDITNIFNITYP